MSEKEGNKSFAKDDKHDPPEWDFPKYTQTVMTYPPRTQIFPENEKRRIQYSSTSSSHPFNRKQMYLPSSYINIDIENDRIPMVDIDDYEKDLGDDKIKKFGPLIMWIINALCNFIMLFGCGLLLYFYYKSSVQSSYVTLAKAYIIVFFVIEIIVRTINLLQMKYYDLNFVFYNGLGVLCFKKESYLAFSTEWIEVSQIIRLADTADNTCFIIPSLFLLHLITYYMVYKDDPISVAVDNTCKIMEIFLSFPAIILVITRIWAYEAIAIAMAAITLILRFILVIFVDIGEIAVIVFADFWETAVIIRVDFWETIVIIRVDFWETAVIICVDFGEIAVIVLVDSLMDNI
ncbi:12428_t:CDS:2 [Funneliformis geosporum]|uniref:9476_t:CDS:1 n=1 Tax=Funneliformis geosporum TaxID=1117311 RepID=A0A9W4SDX6_9GLOM|nr:9476_t:CDS:2 [Funneliformis geosporum]CAI2164361.1 12428_t:CDS:2 [Funneliformis geosporum]